LIRQRRPNEGNRCRTTDVGAICVAATERETFSNCIGKRMARRRLSSGLSPFMYALSVLVL
jgi:hypothetical protein